MFLQKKKKKMKKKKTFSVGRLLTVGRTRTSKQLFFLGLRLLQGRSAPTFYKLVYEWHIFSISKEYYFLKKISFH